MKGRLKSLDGLRGLAVTLVVLFHLNRDLHVSHYLTPFWSSFSHIFFGGGQVGVDLFFLLSGFLIAYLYPNVSDFWSYTGKRWGRIFPVFWAAVILAFIVFVFPAVTLPLGMFAVISILALGYMLQKPLVEHYQTKVFWWFFTLQIVSVTIGLIFSLVFAEKISEAQLLTRGLWNLLSNLTLTVPFYSNLGYLEGAFWTLQNEVVWYMFYPLAILPLLTWFHKGSKLLKAIWILIGVIVGTAALQTVGEHILSLGLAAVFRTPGLFIGALIGHYLVHKPESQKTIWNAWCGKLLKSRFWQISVLILIPAVTWLDSFWVNQNPTIWNHMFHNVYLIPLTLVFLTCLEEDSYISKLMSKRFFVYLGSVSYSWYLTHNSIIKLVANTFPDLPPNLHLLELCITFFLTLIVGSLFSLVFEHPYFAHKQSFATPISTAPKLLASPLIFFEKTLRRFISGAKKKIMIILTLFAVIGSGLLLWQADPSFGVITTLPRQEALAPFAKLEDTTLRAGQKISGTIQSEHNNFGILSLKIEYVDEKQTARERGGSENEYIFRIKEEGDAEWAAESKKSLASIYGWYPFGFPVFPNSKNKNYIWELEVVGLSPTQVLRLQTVQEPIRTHYLVEKKELIKNPSYLLDVLSAKLRYSLIVENTFALILLCWVPLIWYILGKKFLK